MIVGELTEVEIVVSFPSDVSSTLECIVLTRLLRVSRGVDPIRHVYDAGAFIVWVLIPDVRLNVYVLATLLCVTINVCPSVGKSFG